MKFPSLRRFSLCFLVGASPALHGCKSAPQVKLTPLTDRVRVEIGGHLFTEYFFQGAKRPYCYPVLAVDGTSLVRDFPMKETAGEDVDHPHHRSLWFAHSNVNGIDFWNEGTAGTRFPKGSIEHEALTKTKSGSVGMLCDRNRWLAPDGKLICTDERTLRFRGDASARMIDFAVTLHALPDAPLVMGDNKDGTMAIRLAQWLTMPHKIQQKDIPGIGHIVTAKGERDSAAWGTRADWCDYFAEHNGTIYGVAIFDHPENLRHPTWWMARDYGLFGANPFGQHDFEPAAKHPEGKGNYTIPAGGSLTLRYRFYFHTGDEKTARIAERYADYVAGK
jgi:Methane oxygenase PmoA